MAVSVFFALFVLAGSVRAQDTGPQECGACRIEYNFDNQTCRLKRTIYTSLGFQHCCQNVPDLIVEGCMGARLVSTQSFVQSFKVEPATVESRSCINGSCDPNAASCNVTTFRVNELKQPNTGDISTNTLESENDTLLIRCESSYEVNQLRYTVENASPDVVSVFWPSTPFASGVVLVPGASEDRFEPLHGTVVAVNTAVQATIGSQGPIRFGVTAFASGTKVPMVSTPAAVLFVVLLLLCVGLVSQRRRSV